MPAQLRAPAASVSVWLATALVVLAAAVVPPAHAAGESVSYHIVVSPEGGPELYVHMAVAKSDESGAPAVSVHIQLPEGVAPESVIASGSEAAGGARGVEGRERDDAVRITPVSPRIVHVSSDAGSSVAVRYPVRLRGGLQNPATQSGAPYTSVHLGDFVYVAGRDTLARVVDGAPASSAHLTVSVPAGWRAFALNLGPVSPERPLAVENLDELVFLAGPLSVNVQESDGRRLTMVTAGPMPWQARDAVQSARAMITSLADKGFGRFLTDVTLVHIRYPGALRLSPVIASHTVGDGTLVQWIGTGGLDWWRKHAARDLIAWLLQRTVTVAPEAAWFTAGLPEYAALLLLHHLDYVSDHDMYHALHTLYATGVHYTGPGWPSPASAGVASPPSHAAQRVLQFGAPLVVFLLDVELRAASGGAASILDVWLHAAQTQDGAHAPLHTAALLPPPAKFGDLSSFAENFLFGNRIPPSDFDGVYRRWLGTQ